MGRRRLRVSPIAAGVLVAALLAVVTSLPACAPRESESTKTTGAGSTVSSEAPSPDESTTTSRAITPAQLAALRQVRAGLKASGPSWDKLLSGDDIQLITGLAGVGIYPSN